MTQQRLIILLVGAVVILFGAYTLINSGAGANGNLTTKVVPSDSELTLDGNKISANATINVNPGTHTIIGKRSGFADTKKTFTIAEGEKMTVNVLLSANSPEGSEWIANHPEETAEGDGVVSNEIGENTEAAEKKYPIIKELPVIETNFRIDYGASQKNPNKKGEIAIYIQASTENGRLGALDWMDYFGYNPADYEIIYTVPPAN